MVTISSDFKSATLSGCHNYERASSAHQSMFSPSGCLAVSHGELSHPSVRKLFACNSQIFIFAQFWFVFFHRCTFYFGLWYIHTGLGQNHNFCHFFKVPFMHLQNFASLFESGNTWIIKHLKELLICRRSENLTCMGLWLNIFQSNIIIQRFREIIQRMFLLIISVSISKVCRYDVQCGEF